MERVERGTVRRSISEVPIHDTQATVSRWMRHVKLRLGHLFIHQGFLLLLVGFLLGRALILSKLTPFALPFFVSVYMLRRDKAAFALISLLAGALTLSLDVALFVGISIFGFLFI